MEVLLVPYDDNDRHEDEFYELLDEYHEKYRCLPNDVKQLPCGSIDAHSVCDGLCFEFSSSDDVRNAHSHLLETEWFAATLKAHPKFYFRLDDLDEIHGLSAEGITCSVDGEVDMNSEWNKFATQMRGLDN